MIEKGGTHANGYELMRIDDIQSRIYTIRGVQVMYDNDLAELYGVETKRLNEQVKRNRERFPEEFMFQLTDKESASLWSQNATLETGRGRHRKYLSYVFTEQGVAMLSAVLRSDVAVEISVKIINAFVGMRRFLASNAQVFQRLDILELKQLETDERMEKVLNAIESREIQPKQGIFFDGQIFDAYDFVSKLFRSAKESIVIIDNYLDDSVLTHLTKKKRTSASPFSRIRPPSRWLKMSRSATNSTRQSRLRSSKTPTTGSSSLTISQSIISVLP
jgi:phage regulator Rha-like protein